MSSSTPGWRQRAAELETAGAFEEAEELIRASVPHMAFAAEIAAMYADRMRRLQGAGDRDGAARAYADAERWIDSYASMATSGGEGYALAGERDRFLDALRRAYEG